MYELGKHHGIRHVTKLIQAFMGDDMTGANRTENKS